MAASSVAAFLIFTDCLRQLSDKIANLHGKLTFGFESQVFLIFSERALVLVYFQQYISGQQMSFRKIRLELQRVADSRSRLRDVLPIPVETCQRKVTVPGFVVELESVEQSFLGFFKTLLPPVDFTKGNRRRRIIRLKFERALQCTFSFGPVSRIDESRRQQKLRFKENWVDKDRLLQM